MLVNARYFKASWLQSFDKDATADADFHLADGSPRRGPDDAWPGRGMSAGDGWRAARIDYSGFTLAMTVVLPDEGREDDLDALIGGGGLSDLLAGGAVRTDLTLPRWKFLVGSSLQEPLEALGMVSAFHDGADFSAMTKQEGCSASRPSSSRRSSPSTSPARRRRPRRAVV